MNPANPIDPEELRLRDALVESAGRLSFSSAISVRDPFVIAIIDASNALADFRAKASAPVTPRYCEPLDVEKYGWHWVHLMGVGSHSPMQWTHPGAWFDGDRHLTAGEAYSEGWRYHSVASPAAHDIRQPVTDEALREFWYNEGASRLSTECGAQILRKFLTHFSVPTVSPGVEGRS